MSRIIFFLVLIAGGIVGATLLFNRPVTTQATTTDEPVLAQSVNEISVKSQDGIEITIEDVAQNDTETVVTLSMNNHRFNLSEDVIYTSATLNGEPSSSHILLSDAVGGHHVEAEIVFPKTNSGSLVITPVEDNVFKFDDLWQ